MRAGADTQIGLEALRRRHHAVQGDGRHAAFDFRRLPDRQIVEIDTPRAAFTVDRPGYYRVDVEEQRTTFSARRGGFARVVAENGGQLEVGADQQLVLADDNPTFGVTPVAALDDWDRWNDERTASFAETPQSAKYVSQQVAGIDDSSISTVIGTKSRATAASGGRVTSARTGRRTARVAGSTIPITSGHGSTTRRGAGRRITTVDG